MDLLISLELGEAKIKEVSKRVSMNYFHISMVLQQWQKEGIINKVRQEKSLDISLTKKGKLIVDCLKKLKNIIDHYDESVKMEEMKHGTRNKRKQEGK